MYVLYFVLHRAREAVGIAIYLADLHLFEGEHLTVGNGASRVCAKYFESLSQPVKFTEFRTRNFWDSRRLLFSCMLNTSA